MFGVVAQVFLRVFKQEGGAEIGAFGAVEPAQAFHAFGFGNRGADRFFAAADVFHVQQHVVVTRQLGQAGDFFVERGVFVDVVNDLVEHRLQLQKADVVFAGIEGFDRHHQVVHAVVGGAAVFFQIEGERLLSCH